MRRALLVLALVSLAAGAASAQLAAPEGARPARTTRGAVLDCAEHGVWTAPPGWAVSTDGDLTIAVAPGGVAALIRARARPRLRDDAGFAAQVSAIVARIAGDAPALGAIEAIDRDRWRRERTVLGSARGGSLAVIARALRTEALWVGLHAPGDAASRAAIDAAIASWLMLTSHACACGYDCDHR